MITNNDAVQQFLDARMAVRDKTNPQAFLRLGIHYAQGIGTSPNPVLANYFFEKAHALGCEEVEGYLEQEYELGTKIIIKDFEKHIPTEGPVDPQVVSQFRKILEKARVKKNYGLLSQLQKYLTLFYPDYDKHKAIDDILNGRDTSDADIYYTLCTSNNKSEICVDLQECLLHQLFAPVTQDDRLMQLIRERDDTDLLLPAENDFMQCLINFSSAYYGVCKKYKVKKQTIAPLDSLAAYPYIHVSTLISTRKQALRCLLSVKDVNPIITEKYLENLGNDIDLLNICEELKGDLQMFLITFVELHLDIETILREYLSLVKSHRKNDTDALAVYLNDFLKRLSRIGIDHQLPTYSSDNLPPIKIDYQQ